MLLPLPRFSQEPPQKDADSSGHLLNHCEMSDGLLVESGAVVLLRQRLRFRPVWKLERGWRGCAAIPRDFALGFARKARYFRLQLPELRHTARASRACGRPGALRLRSAVDAGFAFA